MTLLLILGPEFARNGRQAFNIDATWVNALPYWQQMYIHRSQSGPAITDTSTSRFGLVPRCRLAAVFRKRSSPTMRALACFLQLGAPGQATHSSNRRMISMRLHPNRMREPHNMNGTP